MASIPVKFTSTTGTAPSGAIPLAAYGLPTGAPLASPAFTGTPTAPTAPFGTSNTQIATTAHVSAATRAKPATVALVNAATVSAAPSQTDFNALVASVNSIIAALKA